MRIVQFEIAEHGRRLGVVDGDRVLDVTSVRPEWKRTVDVFQTAQADGSRFEDLLATMLDHPGIGVLSYSDLLVEQPDSTPDTTDTKIRRTATMRTLQTPLFIFCLVFGSGSRAAAGDIDTDRTGNWHQWRGPLATGVAPRGNPPLKWGEKTNLKWKVLIPGRGSSTPIIWKNKVILLTAVKTGRIDKSKAKPEDQPRRPFGIRYPNAYFRFIVMCLDRGTGKVLWQKVAREAVPPEGRHGDNNYASASPTTDGKFLYASFGSNGIYCYDLAGNKQWERDLGDMKTRLSFGGGSSPVIHGNSLVVNWDHDGPSFIAVLNAKNGKVKWKKPRDERSAWATPLVIEHKGTTQIITNANKRVRGYDLKNGNVLWECGGQKFNVTPSPVARDGIVYCMSGYRGSAAYAIPLSASGDITGSDKIVWTIGRDTPYIPSPLLYGDLLYFTKSNSGILTAVDAKTGKVVIPAKRLSGIRRMYASPVAAAGKVYLQSRGGRTLVIKHGRKFEVLAENRIDDRTDASPAIVGRQLFLRGTKSLYCFEKPTAK